MQPKIQAAQREFFVTRARAGSPPDERKEEYRHCRGYHRNSNAIVVLNLEYIPQSFIVCRRSLYICNIYEDKHTMNTISFIIVLEDSICDYLH